VAARRHQQANLEARTTKRANRSRGVRELLSQKGIEEDFAQDLTAAEKAHLVAAQPKTSGAIFEAKPTAAAWRAKPAWYVVSSNDRMIDREQEKSMALAMLNQRCARYASRAQF
jgi:hypothetical protein